MEQSPEKKLLLIGRKHMGYSLRSVAPVEGQTIWGTHAHSPWQAVIWTCYKFHHSRLLSLTLSTFMLRHSITASLVPSSPRCTNQTGLQCGGSREVCHCWSAPAKQSQLLPECQSFCAYRSAAKSQSYWFFLRLSTSTHRRVGAHSQQVK